MKRTIANDYLLRGAVLAAMFTWGSSGNAEDLDDVRSTAALIDQQVFQRLQDEGVAPAPPATDAAFLRRAWLDIAGQIPPAARARRFLADADAHKRSRAVDELLMSSGYVRHYTSFWRGVLMPEVQSNEQVRRLLPGFDAWLGQHLAANTPYDRLVREIVNTPLAARGRDQQAARNGTEQSAIAFFQAKEIAPENLAAATSRIFLGIRIECAQCHDHPFDDWKKQQFWSYASFFAGIERQGDDGIFGRVEEVFDRRELAIPDTEIVVQAGYLDGGLPRWRRGAGSREVLADWITSSDNPYFARMAVNRIWGKLFGIGLVDPVDDFTAHNACSHPELLDALAARFVERDFDLKFLIRAITTSRAWRLSSLTPGKASADAASVDPRFFASMPIKGLTPDQLIDSFVEAAGLVEPMADPAPNGDNRGGPRAALLELFANDTDPVTEQQTTILQALALMNGPFMASALDPGQSRTLAAANDPALNAQQRVEALFLATLGRPPAPEESQPFVDYVASGGTTNSQPQALADVFWALLNSAEFATNH